MQIRRYFFVLNVADIRNKLEGSENMKKLNSIILLVAALAFVYAICTIYTNRIEKIENREMIQVSESYMDR